MKKEVVLNNKKIEYDHIYKNVKNINLRIRPDGSISLSSNRWVPQRVVDDFLISKSDFILTSLEKYQRARNTPREKYFDETEIRDKISEICKMVYPYFEEKGIGYPIIKFRKMTSRWGSCHPQKGILTFSLNLIYVPEECIEYVVLHEFTHFLVANHSGEFYCELEKVCPDWKLRRKKLKCI